jgi:aerobic carbon-monoxide dehydrogenase large subunit
MSSPGTTAKLLGARVRRLEDPRVLLGRTRFVDDVQLPGALAIAFVRSPHAHARIRSVDVGEAQRASGVHAVLAASDLEGFLPPLRVEHDPAVDRPPCRTVVWPVLASGKVRFVGEAVVAVLAESRAQAEDAAALVEIDWDPLDPVVDVERAAVPGAPRVHAEWPDNVFQRVEASLGDVSGAFRAAAVVVSERFRSGRHLALPMEGRGVVASWDPAAEMLTVWASTQMPHVLRAEIARFVSLGEHSVRVIAVDVGGGFGLKAHVFPEELLAAALARRIARPVEWIEDRREHLAASQHARDQIVRAELAVANDGTFLGLRAHVTCDIGAYTEYPWPTFEANVTTMAMPGPYTLRAFAYETLSVATNKCSIGSYRGVGQPIGVLAMERLIDMAAEKLGLDRAEIRRRNMIARDQHPYTTVLGTEIESGSHRECLAKALEMIDAGGLLGRQEQARARGHRRGLGIASYVEATAPSSKVWQMLGPAVGGCEPATVRMETDGRVVVAVGVNSQGQSHETTFAQIAADRLGVSLADVRVVQGDTATTPRGWVTGGSKGAVVTGGAVLRAAETVRAKILFAASRLAEIPEADLDLRDGAVRHLGDGASIVAIADVARAIWLGRAALPPADEPGLEVTVRYEPPPLTHSNATHAVEVDVDVETGRVEIVRYVVVEDCGTILNPLVVDGQIQGGVAQGIGSALYEEIVYDENGQLLTGTLMDYLPPTAADVPRVEIAHIETPSPYTAGGMKGMGEGGAIAPPAAIANAVADALREFSPGVNRLPLTPERVLAMIDDGGKG